MNPPEERYFTSTPCKRGHSGRRYKSTGGCVECQRMHHLARHPPKKQAVTELEVAAHV